MPKLRISAPRGLDPALGLPWHAARHVLTLCDLHLTPETRARLRDDRDALQSTDAQVYASRYVEDDPHVNHDAYVVAFQDGADVSGLPRDLRDCVALAASQGFDAISFEPHDPQDCPLIEALPSYPAETGG